jgi:hypothetical protein
MLRFLTGIRLDRDIVLAFTGLWLATVLLVYWDTGRRGLATRERAAWLLLTLLPFVGAGLYFWLKYGAPLRQPKAAGRRVTLLRPPDPPAGRSGTIAVADVRGSLPALSPPAAPRPLTLSVTKGPYRGRSFALDSLPALIGRGAGCAICLDDDPAVSRQHAELYRDGSGLRLRDLGSKHGTRLNGRRLTDGPVAPGDRIGIGGSTLALGERQ